MTRLLLCDLDDTLVERTATFARWVDGFLAARGVDGAQREWVMAQDQRGYRRRDDLFAAMKVRFGLAEDVAALIGGFYAEFGPMFRCEDAVRDALMRARSAGWKIAIVTNGSPTQEGKITAAGLPELVDGWCISAVEGCRKPDAQILERAAEKCGASLDGAWMIGDSPEMDIGVAHAAGIRSVWIGCHVNWPHGAPISPTFIAGSFPDALDLVLAVDH